MFENTEAHHHTHKTKYETTGHKETKTATVIMRIQPKFIPLKNTIMLVCSFHGQHKREERSKHIFAENEWLSAFLLRIFCMYLPSFMSVSLSCGCYWGGPFFPKQKNNKKTECFFCGFISSDIPRKNTQNNSTSITTTIFFNDFLTFFLCLRFDKKKRILWHFIAKWWFYILASTEYLWKQ